MAIERINSVFDEAALGQEFANFEKNVRASYDEVVKLYESIKKYKTVDFKNIAAETDKLSQEMAKAAEQTKKLEEAQRRAEEAMKRATIEAIVVRQNNVNLQKSYGDMSGSVADNIKQQLRLKAELQALQKQQKDLAVQLGATGGASEALTQKQIEVARSIEEVKQASSELGRTIRLQVKEQQSAGESLDQMKARYDRLYQVFRGLSDSDRNSEIGSQLNKDLEELSSRINDVQKSAGNFSGNVGRYIGSLQPAFQVLVDELTNIRGQLAGMDSGAAGFDELIKQEKLLTQLTDGLTKEFTSVTTEVRALQKAAASVGVEFGTTSELFQKFRDEVGAGVDAVGDIRAQVNLAASDTRQLDGMIAAAEGLAGAYSVAEGTAALFGGESEALMQTMVKLQAVMSVLNGLQAIRNAMQKESAAMDFLQTARLKIMTVAQTLYSRAVAASTLAMGSFGKALLLTGIFAFIPLLAAGAKALYDFAKASKDTSEAEKRNDEVRKASVDGYIKQKLQLESLTNAVKKGGLSFDEKKEVLRRYNETFGDSIGKAKDFEDAEKRIIELGPQYIAMLQAQAKAQAAFDLAIEANKKALEVMEEGPDIGWLDALRIGAIQHFQGIGNATAEQIKLQAEQAKSSRDNSEAYLKIFEESEKEAQKIKEQYGFKSKETDNKNTKSSQDAANKRKEIAAREAQAKFEIDQMILQRRLDLQKRVVDDEAALAVDRVMAVNQAQEIERQIIENDARFKKQNKQLTDAEILKIEVETQNKLADLTLEGQQKRQQIMESQRQREKEDAEAFAAEMQALPERIRQQVTQAEEGRSLADSFFPNDAELTSKIELLTTKLKQGQITYEQYQKELDALNEEYANRELQRQARVLQGVISVLQSRGMDVTTEQQRLNEIMRQLYQKDSENYAKAQEEKIRTAQEKQQELVNTITNIQTVQQNLTAGIGDILSISLDRQAAALEELEAKQERAYANEVERINASTMSEEEKANKLKILEAERQVQKEEIERKNRRIALERARFERLQSIANIITGTALAVVNALQTKPAPLGIALAATVGALGAAQLARAIATPLPRFERGTQSSPEGWAVTDEKGPELYVEPGGKAYMGQSQGPVLRYLKKGTKVIPADQVNEALHQAMMQDTARVLQGLKAGEKKPDPLLAEIKDAITLQTELTIRELKKSKGKQNININFDNGNYIRNKTFN